MTNEEIIDTTRGTELWQYYGEEINKLLDLARQDEREKWKPYLLDSVLTDAEFKEYTGSEREKMQGVDVWVSWDKHKRQEVYPVLTFTEPATESRPSYFTYYKTDDESYATITPKEAKSLGVSEGQCKKFRIVEELP